MAHHRLNAIWAKYTISPDPLSGVPSLHQVCLALTKHSLEPSDIIGLGTGFTLHPDLAQQVSHVCTAMDLLLRPAARHHFGESSFYIGNDLPYVLTGFLGETLQALQCQIISYWILLLDHLETAMRELQNYCIGDPCTNYHLEWTSPYARLVASISPIFQGRLRACDYELWGLLIPWAVHEAAENAHSQSHSNAVDIEVQTSTATTIAVSPLEMPPLVIAVDPRIATGASSETSVSGPLELETSAIPPSFRKRAASKPVMDLIGKRETEIVPVYTLEAAIPAAVKDPPCTIESGGVAGDSGLSAKSILTPENLVTLTAKIDCALALEHTIAARCVKEVARFPPSCMLARAAPSAPTPRTAAADIKQIAVESGGPDVMLRETAEFSAATQDTKVLTSERFSCTFNAGVFQTSAPPSASPPRLACVPNAEQTTSRSAEAYREHSEMPLLATVRYLTGAHTHGIPAMDTHNLLETRESPIYSDIVNGCTPLQGHIPAPVFPPGIVLCGNARWMAWRAAEARRERLQTAALVSTQCLLEICAGSPDVSSTCSAMMENGGLREDRSAADRERVHQMKDAPAPAHESLLFLAPALAWDVVVFGGRPLRTDSQDAVELGGLDARSREQQLDAVMLEARTLEPNEELTTKHQWPTHGFDDAALTACAMVYEEHLQIPPESPAPASSFEGGPVELGGWALAMLPSVAHNTVATLHSATGFKTFALVQARGNAAEIFSTFSLKDILWIFRTYLGFPPGQNGRHGNTTLRRLDSECFEAHIPVTGFFFIISDFSYLYCLLIQWRPGLVTCASPAHAISPGLDSLQNFAEMSWRKLAGHTGGKAWGTCHNGNRAASDMHLLGHASGMWQLISHPLVKVWDLYTLNPVLWTL
ncbi:hypothetical protein B0H13DRAFT_1909970 [Mycena leptocephala]|nr:hypothetical protein B0H13DRAFT_1909970 [Mycena leptocephala]